MSNIDRRDRGQVHDDEVDALINALNAGSQPEVGDDPELASLLEAARALRQAGEEPEWPVGDFPARLANQLFESLPAVSSNSHRPDERVAPVRTSGWNAPALDTHARRRDRASQRPESDEARIVSALSSTHGQPVIDQPHRWASEFWKIAAAIIAFAAVGALLVLVLRDTGDKQPQIIAPGPTSTSVSSPSSDGTATIDPTRDAAHALLTATVSTFATTQAGLPSPGEVVATILVNDTPIGLASAAGSLWVANSEGSVARIDPATNAIVARIAVPVPPGGGPMPFYIASYNDQIWISGQVAGTPIYRIDPATNQIVQTIPLVAADGSDPLVAANDSGGFGVSSLFVDATGIWVSDFDGGRLVRIDPASGSVVATIDVPGARGIASGFGSLWVISNDTSRLCVMRIDPASNSVVNIIDTGRSAEFITTGAGAVWEAADAASGIVTRIDPTTNAVAATIDTGLRETRFLLIAGGKLWVNGWLGSTGFNNGLLTIDPATNALSRYIDYTPSISWWLAEFDGSIWATHTDVNVVVRIDPAP